MPFTRDFESLKCALTKVELYNKTCIETALAAVSTVVQEEWSTGVPCQVGHRKLSLQMRGVMDFFKFFFTDCVLMCCKLKASSLIH